MNEVDIFLFDTAHKLFNHFVPLRKRQDIRDKTNKI